MTAQLDHTISPALREARSSLARDLHDGPVQRLTSMVMVLENLKLGTAVASEGRSPVDEVQALARATISDLRELICGLRSAPSSTSSFVDEVRRLVDRTLCSAGISSEVDAHGWPSRLSDACASELLRIVEEALRNVRRHSGARHVSVTLQVVSGACVITVADDGCGMDASSTLGGFGIRGMRERALLLRGRIVIDTAPECGTTLRVIVPLDRP